MAGVEFRELRVYLAVVEEGSLSAAARRLHRSQSSVSDAIAALERQLGVVLLVRNRSGAKETDAGRKLTAGARRLVRSHDRLAAEVSARVGLSGPVRVGAPLELPSDFLPSVIATLGTDYPDLAVEVRHASTYAQWAALRQGRLDVALVRELAPDEAFDSALILEDRLGVVLTEERAEEIGAGKEAIELSQLRDLEWNGFARSDTPASYDHVVSVLRTHGIRVGEHPDDQRPITVEVKLAAISDGSRFALALPDFPVAKGVVWRRLAGDPIVRRTWAVWRAEETSPAVAVVVAALEAKGDHGQGE
jgi:molybdate transport repressor ModE-like protein